MPYTIVDSKKYQAESSLFLHSVLGECALLGVDLSDAAEVGGIADRELFDQILATQDRVKQLEINVTEIVGVLASMAELNQQLSNALEAQSRVLRSLRGG